MIEVEVLDDLPIEVDVPSDGMAEIEVSEQIVIGGAANLQDKTVNITPTESAQSQTVRADVGYDALDEVEVNVSAVSDTYVGSAVPRRASSSLTVSGNTVTAPAGFYAQQASKSVPANVLEVMAYYDEDENWHLNKTFSELAAAYTAGQDICIYADSGMSAVAGGDWYTGGVEFDFEVYQYTMDADNINDLVKVEQWGYGVTSSGQTRYAHTVTYDTYLTDAVAADIRSGKKAISTTGLVTGTAVDVSTKYETGTITLASDWALSTSAQNIPGLQLSFQPDFFYIIIDRDSFTAKTSPVNGFYGMLAVKKTWAPPFATSTSATQETTDNDYRFFNYQNVIANSAIDTGYGINGALTNVGTSYYSRYSVNANGTVSIGKYSSAGTSMKSGTYRYFACKL